MRKKIHTVLQMAFYNFRLWKGNVRVITTFILAFILCFFLTDKLIMFAEENHTTLQITEAFIWTFGDSNSILLASILLLLLFADLPFLTTAVPFFLFRGSRVQWVIGQILYIGMATFLYLAFIFFSTCMLSMKLSYVKNSWSKTAATLAYSRSGKVMKLPVEKKILEMSRPCETVITIFLLLLFYALVMMFIMLFLHIWKGRLVALAGTFLFCIYGVLLNPENIQKILNLPEAFYYKARVWLGWISPLNHATYSMHNFGYDKLPVIGESFAIFLGGLLILTILTIKKMKYYNFEFKGTEN